MSTEEQPGAPPPGLPEGANFIGLARWHRNELRLPVRLANQAFPSKLLSAAKAKDQPITTYSVKGDGSEPHKFDVRLGTSGGKWRLAGATELVRSLGAPPDIKLIAVWKTPDERLFLSSDNDPTELAEQAEGGKREEAVTEPEQPKHKKVHKRQARQERNRAAKHQQDSAGEGAGGGTDDGEAGVVTRSGGRRKRQRAEEHEHREEGAAAGTSGAGEQQTAEGAADGERRCAARVCVTGRMRQGGYLVLHPAFAALAGLSVEGEAHAASVAVELLEPDGSLVPAVLALSVVPAGEGAVVEADVAGAAGADGGAGADGADGADGGADAGAGAGEEDDTGGAGGDDVLVSGVVLTGLGDWMQRREVGAGCVVIVARTVAGMYYIAVEKGAGAGDEGAKGVSVGDAAPGAESGSAAQEGGGDGAAGAPAAEQSGAGAAGDGTGSAEAGAAADADAVAGASGDGDGRPVGAGVVLVDAAGEHEEGRAEAGKRHGGKPAKQSSDSVWAAWQQLFPGHDARGDCGGAKPRVSHDPEAVARLLSADLLSCTVSATHLLVAQLLAR